jgi:iron(III) transport system permease protein
VVLGRVVLPLAGPYLLAGACLLLVLSLVDYSVPSLFSVTTYSLEVFAEFSTSHDAGAATLIALPLLVVTAVVVILLQHLLRRTSVTGSAPGIGQLRSWPFWFSSLRRLALLVLAAQVLVPLVVLAGAVGTPQSLLRIVAENRQELIYSLVVALVAGLVCIVPALAVASLLAGRRGTARLWWLLVALPLAVPAPLAGIGLTRMWAGTGLASPAAGVVMPVLAALARFTPLAVLVLLARLQRIETDLIDAVRVFQPSRSQGWRLRLRLLLPALLAGAGITFALTIGELGATLIVVPPGSSTMTMKIYSYLHYGASDAVAGSCLLVAVATVAAGALVAAAMAAKPGPVRSGGAIS